MMKRPLRRKRHLCHGGEWPEVTQSVTQRSRGVTGHSGKEAHLTQWSRPRREERLWHRGRPLQQAEGSRCVKMEGVSTWQYPNGAEDAAGAESNASGVRRASLSRGWTGGGEGVFGAEGVFGVGVRRAFLGGARRWRESGTSGRSEKGVICAEMPSVRGFQLMKTPL